MGRPKKQSVEIKKQQLKRVQKKSSQPLGPATKVIQGKRRLNDLSSFLKRQQSISPATRQQKFPLWQHIKSTCIQRLVIQCPELSSVMSQIEQKLSIPRDVLIQLVSCCLNGSFNSLWTDKYSSNKFIQSLHSQTQAKIIVWLKAFQRYRNVVYQESNSLIDDFFGQSNTHFRTIRDFNWKLKALIIKGRPGIGKTSVVKSVAKKLSSQIYHCANHCNQIKYLKQKNQTTQSQSVVRLKVNKSQKQIKKTNKSIKSFAYKKQQSQIQSQSLKIQFMHNVNKFYPQQQCTKFLSELKKTIEQSKIPFIMSLSGSQIPQNLKIYDVIEFKQAQTLDIAQLLFAIYNLEKSMKNTIDMNFIVEKQKFKQVINNSFLNFKFQIHTPLTHFIKLTQIFNKKLNLLFTYVQNSCKYSTDININQAQLIMKRYLTQVNVEKLMQDFFYSSEHCEQENNKMDDNSNSKYQFSFIDIDTNKYMLQTQKQIQQSSKKSSKQNSSCKYQKQRQYYQIEQQKSKGEIENIPTMINTPNKDDQDLLPYLKQKLSSSNNFPQQLSKTLQQIRQQLMLKTISDNRKYEYRDYSIDNQFYSKSSQQCYAYNKLYNQSNDQFESNLMQNISILSHKNVRKHILRNLKKTYFQHNQQQTTLKIQELNFIGLLIDSRTRVSRKNKHNESTLQLNKLLKNNEINYFNTFTTFLKPNCFQNKL